jgi:hypothetical protein
MVLLQGSLVATKGNARSSTSGGPHKHKNMAQKAAEQLSGERAQARRQRWGKTVKGCSSGPLIGGRVPAHPEQLPESSPLRNRGSNRPLVRFLGNRFKLRFSLLGF